MNLITFTYTKSPTDISQRAYVSLSVPNKNYFGIDVSDLDVEDQVLFAAEIEEIERDKQMKIELAMDKYDVRTNFRSFNPEKMSNIVEE